MTVYFQDTEIEAGWEEILVRKDYALRIKEIADSYPDKRSLFVSYNDIDAYSTDLAMFILDHPDKALALGKKVIRDMMPPHWDQNNTINLRIVELPRDARVEIRQLRAKHLGKLVSVEGLVRKATTVKPRMTNALFRCARCETEMWEMQTGTMLREPLMCGNLEGSCNRAATRFILDETRSIYVDTQKIEIQENPEGLRGGAQPERLSGFLEDDISGVVTPGNRTVLNGVIRSVQKGDREKSTIFEIFMDVVSIEFEQHEYDEIQITEEDEEQIRTMSRDPDLFKNIVASISPTIYGLETEKEAIALQLFGGSHKEMDDGTVIRGDMHILLVGDPGVAKSQLLRYMSMLAPRGIYASGKSASAAGLCVHGDTILNLESGDSRIEDLVLSRMTDPEEYREGIWRQPIDGERILSMSEQGAIRALPVTYVWKIRTPEKLIKLTTDDEDVLILTPETKVLAMGKGTFDWTESHTLQKGDMVAICQGTPRRMRFLPLRSVETLSEGLPDFVYDLTVEPAHSFLGNNFVVHNTAAAVKDDFGDGRWTLEAGALVLADKGLACVDELDKMTPQDRSSLHEAMESQKISVAKAGITATLQCRCSMLAAANPKYGRFEERAGISDQIELPPALLSRFDMIFVLTDKPQYEKDKNITKHILKAHKRGQVRRKENVNLSADADKILKDTSDIRPVYDIEVLRKYVAYSKRIVPILTEEATDLIQESYLDIRNTGTDQNSSVPITARQLEAFVRLSEASARARLSSMVERQDAERAVRLVKYYMDKIVSTSTGAWDIDNIATGVSKKDRDLIPMVKSLMIDYGVDSEISLEELITHGLSAGINASDITTTISKMRATNDIFCPRPGREVYKLV